MSHIWNILKKPVSHMTAAFLCLLMLLTCVPATAMADVASDSNVLHTADIVILRDGPSVSKSPSGETVDVDGSCSFIAKASGATKMQWKFTDPSGKVYTAAQAKAALKGLRIKGDTSEKVILSHIPAEMSGWKIFCVFSNSAGKTAETKKATIKVRQPKPVITKNPGGETVDADGKASFIAKADNDTEITWYLIKGKTKVKAKDATKKFSGLKVSGSSEEKLLLTNIPASLDGWQVYAVFANDAGSVESAKATIKVNVKATPKPTTNPIPVAEDGDQPDTPQAPGNIPTMDDEPLADGEDSTAVHEHSFAAQWTSNENGHFHVCECGETSELVPHEMTFKTIAKATKKLTGKEIGTCSVCGFQVERDIPVVASSGPSTGLVILMIVLILVILGIMGIFGYGYYRTLQRRKRRSRHTEEAMYEEDYPKENDFEDDGYYDEEDR